MSFLGINLNLFMEENQFCFALELLDIKSLIWVFPVHLRSSSPVPWSCQRVTLLNMGERKRRISSSGSVNGGLVEGTLPRFTTQKRKMVESSVPSPASTHSSLCLFVCVPVLDVSCASGTLLYHLPCQLSVCLSIFVRTIRWKRNCGFLTYGLAPWPATALSELSWTFSSPS